MCYTVLSMDGKFIEHGVGMMAKSVSVGLDEVSVYFAQLEDPRGVAQIECTHSIWVAKRQEVVNS